MPTIISPNLYPPPTEVAMPQERMLHPAEGGSPLPTGKPLLHNSGVYLDLHQWFSCCRSEYTQEDRARQRIEYQQSCSSRYPPSWPWTAFLPAPGSTPFCHLLTPLCPSLPSADPLHQLWGSWESCWCMAMATWHMWQWSGCAKCGVALCNGCKACCATGTRILVV